MSPFSCNVARKLAPLAEQLSSVGQATETVRRLGADAKARDDTHVSTAAWMSCRGSSSQDRRRGKLDLRKHEMDSPSAKRVRLQRQRRGKGPYHHRSRPMQGHTNGSDDDESSQLRS